MRALTRLRPRGEVTVGGDVLRWDGTEVTILSGDHPTLTVAEATAVLAELTAQRRAVA